MSADIGRTHSIVHVADTGHEQGCSTQLVRVGAVRRQVRVTMNVGAVMQQRHRTHLAGRQLEPDLAIAGGS